MLEIKYKISKEEKDQIFFNRTLLERTGKMEFITDASSKKINGDEVYHKVSFDSTISKVKFTTNSNLSHIGKPIAKSGYSRGLSLFEEIEYIDNGKKRITGIRNVKSFDIFEVNNPQTNMFFKLGDIVQITSYVGKIIEFCFDNSCHICACIETKISRGGWDWNKPFVSAIVTAPVVLLNHSPAILSEDGHYLSIGDEAFYIDSNNIMQKVIVSKTISKITRGKKLYKDEFICAQSRVYDMKNLSYNDVVELIDQLSSEKEKNGFPEKTDNFISALKNKLNSIVMNIPLKR